MRDCWNLWLYKGADDGYLRWLRSLGDEALTSRLFSDASEPIQEMEIGEEKINSQDFSKFLQGLGLEPPKDLKYSSKQWFDYGKALFKIGGFERRGTLMRRLAGSLIAKTLSESINE